MSRSYTAFLSLYPEFADTSEIDRVRQSDYARLNEQNHIYLDYTGAGLYASSQIEEHTRLLQDHIFGNPHSTNPSSMAATKFVDSARAYVLQYFKADPAEYDVIFTFECQRSIKDCW